MLKYVKNMIDMEDLQRLYSIGIQKMRNYM